MIQEVVVDLDEAANEAVVVVHWTGGRHTEIRVERTKTGRYPDDRHPSPVKVMRKLGGHWPDRELAVTMNRMRCKSANGQSWTAVRVRELRERLGIAPYDSTAHKAEVLTVDEAARRLQICVGSVYSLIRSGTLPATQLLPSAPWQIPADALDSEAVVIGVRQIVARRPRNIAVLQEEKTLKLPGF
jgi:excisionase family DNA binding protein